MTRCACLGSEGLGEAEVQDAAKGFAAFESEERVFAPGIGAGGIFGLGDDVIVAGHERGHFIGQKRLCPRSQTLHPCEFVVILGTRHGIAVGKIKPADPNGFVTDDGRFDPAGLFVGLVTGKAAHHILEREFRQ